MGLLRMIFWVALFLVSTFAFTVLFQYGTSDYVANAHREWASLVTFYHTNVQGGAPAVEKKP